MKNSILKFVIPTVIISLFIAGVSFAASQVFNSRQLAPNPSNTNCLTTDGNNNVWSSSCGSGGGGGSASASLPSLSVQYNNGSNLLAGSANLLFLNSATTLALNGTLNASSTKVTNATSTNQTVTSLSSGNCVQASTGGLLATVANPCGTVTSVALTVPTGLSISGSPITTSGTLGLTLTAGYGIPLTASTTQWSNLYNNIYTTFNISTGTAGSIFNIATTTNSLILNLPFASGSNTGQLQATDWTTFNNKVPTSRQILTTAPLQGGGDLSADRTHSINFAPALSNGGIITGSTTTNSLYVLATGTVGSVLEMVNNIPQWQATSTLGLVTAVTGTSPITSSGGTAPAIGVNTGDLTLTSSNLSFGSGDGKKILLGTTTNITLAASPSFTNLTLSGTLSVTGTSTLATTTATQLTVGNLTSGNCVQAGTGGLLTTVGAACGSGGSGNSAWTIGLGDIYNATTTDQVLIGETATSSTSTLEIKGRGANPLFQLSSSTTISMVRVNANNSVAIGTTTSASLFFLQATSSNASLPLFTIASSSGATMLNLDQNGLFTWQPTATSSTAMLWQNPSGQTVLQGDMTALSPGLTIGTTTTSSLYTNALLEIVGNSASTTINLFSVASSTGTSAMTIDSKGHLVFGSASGATTMGTCGTSPSVVGNDTSGDIQTGTGSPTACTLNFAQAFTNVRCVSSDNSTAVTEDVSATTTTSVTFSLSAGLSSAIIHYLCWDNK